MPNSETIAQAMTSKGGFMPSDNTFATNAETQFTKSGNILALALPGSNKIKNVPIRIKAWGRVNGGTTTNFTAQIYSGSSTTIGSNTAIATSGAIAVNNTSGNWMLEVKGIWDGDSNRIAGKLDGWVNATSVAAAIATSVTQPAAAPSTEGLGLSVTGTFSVTNATNTAYLDGFEIERI